MKNKFKHLNKYILLLKKLVIQFVQNYYICNSSSLLGHMTKKIILPFPKFYILYNNVYNYT